MVMFLSADSFKGQLYVCVEDVEVAKSYVYVVLPRVPGFQLAAVTSKPRLVAPRIDAAWPLDAASGVCRMEITYEPDYMGIERLGSCAVGELILSRKKGSEGFGPCWLQFSAAK